MEFISTVQTVENKIGSYWCASKEKEEKDWRKLNFLETVRRERSAPPLPSINNDEF
jgi:hypothetical protein